MNRRPGVAYQKYLQNEDVTPGHIPKQTRCSRKRREGSSGPSSTKQPKTSQQSYERWTEFNPTKNTFEINKDIELHSNPHVTADSESEEEVMELSDVEFEYSEPDDNCIENSSIAKEMSSDPIYENSQLNQGESAHLIFSFAVMHKLTKRAVDDLLELINLHIPLESFFTRTTHFLRKKLSFDYSAVSTHFYCSMCKKYLGEQKIQECPNCLPQDKISQDSFFLSFDIENLLKKLLQIDTVAKNIGQNLVSRKHENTKFSSIFDGLCYKKLALCENDLTCLLNTDGVPVFKSSKFSLWPILCSLNELDYELRRKHTFTLALWFGTEKPNFDSFFIPFLSASQKLATTGIKWNMEGKTVSSKIYFPFLVADSIARPLVHGILQFNGHFGCTWCLSEGETLKINESGSHKWIYPPETSAPLKLRHNDQFIRHLREFESLLAEGDTRKSYFGIRTASKLLLVPKFDIVEGFVFDYMHTALLGISRTFLNLWLDSKNHKDNYYIGSRTKEIDKKLLSCLVPMSFDRTVRSISNRKFWKANEWRTWTFIVGIVLSDILPFTFLNHFLKFVRAMMLLCKHSILKEELDYAERLAVSFVNDTQRLYGNHRCNYNVHLLLHASQCVRNWGPLYQYSAFQFEHFNGILLGFFKGTQNISTQISHHVLELSESYSRQKLFQNSAAKAFYAKLFVNHKHGSPSKIINGFRFFGASNMYYFSQNQKKILNKDGYGFHECALNFKSCLINRKIYNVGRKITSKRCDCVVKSHDKYFIIREFLVLNNRISETALVLVSELSVSYIPTLPFCYSVNEVRTAEEFLPLNEVDNYKFIVHIELNGKIRFIIQIPNLAELE